MNKFLALIIVLLFPILFFGQDNYDSLLKELDKTVDQYQFYLDRKETKIEKLKGLLKYTSTDLQQYEICNELYFEFKAYQLDSALVYARKSLQIAQKINNPKKINQAGLNFALIMGTLGMNKEAIDQLNKVNITNSPDLNGTYFWTQRIIYSNLYDYAVSAQEKEMYLSLAKKNRDLSLSFFPLHTIENTNAKADSLVDKGKYDDAIQLLKNYFPKTTSDNPEKAVIAYMISQGYHAKKDKGLEKKWLTISAISDLQLVKRENISLRKLAFIMYEEGDIDRAYKYIKRSLEDALACNSRLRTYEISKMLPIINEAYQHKNETNRFQLILFLTSVSILSLILLLLLFLLFIQMKKLTKAKKDLSLANEQLSELNIELQRFNQKLNETNYSLIETSFLKEIYIGRYMDQCSHYIGKLEEYRRKLNKMATTGKMNELIHAVKSKEFIETELEEFYSNFDKTFLQLFPNFIKEFSKLLIDEEAIQVKEEELLNTELRIFALIRLGIKDSAKIAVFLRYSISTIYNYRSQLKNKSRGPREEFESKVMLIGTNSK